MCITSSFSTDLSLLHARVFGRKGLGKSTCHVIVLAGALKCLSIYLKKTTFCAENVHALSHQCAENTVTNNKKDFPQII